MTDPRDLLTTGFTLVTLGMVGGLVFHLRRRPIVWLLAREKARVAFHRDTAAALIGAIAAARAAGRDAEADRLAPSLAVHERALRDLAAAAEFAPRR